MIENDTIRLLRQCDAGAKMGIASLGDVIPYAKGELHNILSDYQRIHDEISSEIESMLIDYHDGGKAPNPIAKGMATLKSEVKLAMDSSDHTIASLMTDGCNMGVKSLVGYVNQYKDADDRSKKVACKLIAEEEKLCRDMKRFL